MKNKEIAYVLEELTDDYPREELVRCKEHLSRTISRHITS